MAPQSGKQATDQLDELAKQLQDLVPSPGPARAQAGHDKSRGGHSGQNNQQRVSSIQQHTPVSPDPGDLVVEDDSSDEDGPVMKDGTINASERNPKPLREFLPHRTSVVAAGSNNSSSNNGPSASDHRASMLPSKGPSRPLPPTPDDDETGRPQPQQPQLGGVRSNMPDLLPQTPSNAGSGIMGGPSPGGLGPRGISHDSSAGGGLGSPHPSQQELQVCNYLATLIRINMII